jgi:predicted component of type VI protein secretion system
MEVKLVVVGGKHAGTAIPIPGPKFLIGRGEDCHFRPQSHLVSRRHCAIVVQEDSVAIEDAGSTNGTFVNGEKVQQQELKNGDRIKVGAFELQVELSATLEGKKKPKVHNVQEAAARTVAVAVASEGELDISGWLADDEQEETAAPRLAKQVAPHDTFVGKATDDTTTMQANQDHQKKEKEKQKAPRPKAGSTSLRAVKPMAEDSRSAAEDVLRHFFPRKKA